MTLEQGRHIITWLSVVLFRLNGQTDTALIVFALVPSPEAWVQL